MAEEYQWSVKFAEQSFEEYKKFIYQIYTYDKSLTPSPTIDQVWHFHLLYTKSYWNDFCGNILKREIHHNPEIGAENEKEVFAKNYQDSINLYKKEFGDPPQNIWGTKKINNKAKMSLVTTAVISATIAWVLYEESDVDIVFIIPFIIIFIIAIILIFKKGGLAEFLEWGRGRGGGSCGAGCGGGCGGD